MKNKKEVKKKGHEGIKCPLCGGTLIWGGDANACELSDMYDDDDEAISSNYTCQRCGRFFEIYDPPKEEREEQYREYWVK